MKDLLIYQSCFLLWFYTFVRNIPSEEKFNANCETYFMIENKQWKNLFKDENWISVLEAVESFIFIETNEDLITGLKNSIKCIKNNFPQETRSIFTSKLFA